MTLSQKPIEENLIGIIGKIFATSSNLTKSQHFDLRSSSRILPEVQLWLDVLKLTTEDWLSYQIDSSTVNFKHIEEIKKWALSSSSNTFGLNMIALAVYIAFRVEPEFFKVSFRNWLRANYPSKSPSVVFKACLAEVVIFDTVDIITDFVYC